MSSDDDLPVVHVRVMVNVNSLRVGEEGEVELTPTIQRMINSGYLRILGHVRLPAVPPVVAVEPPPVVLASPTRTRARKAASDGTAGDDPA